jgi:hypothetical protein
LLAEPAAGVCVVVTPEVVLGFMPKVLLVTLKVTVQLLEAGIPIPVKLRAVAPATNVADPRQVPPTGPPTALMLTSVSVNAPPVRAEALLFVRVRITTEVPPDGIVVGRNAFVIVGAVRTGAPTHVPGLFAMPRGAARHNPPSLSCVSTVWSRGGGFVVDSVYLQKKSFGSSPATAGYEAKKTSLMFHDVIFPAASVPICRMKGGSKCW